MTKKIIVNLEKTLSIFIQSTIARMSARYSNINFTIIRDTVIMTSEDDFDEKTIRKELLENLYREKIYSETLSMRQIFLNSVM